MPRFWLFLTLLLSLAAAEPAQAAFPFDASLLTGNGHPAATAAPQKKAYTEAEIQTLKDQTAQGLEQTRQVLAQFPETAPQGEAQSLNTRVQLLQSLDLVYGDLLEGFATQKKVQARLKDLEVEESQWKSGTPPKDFAVDFATLDRLRGQQVEANKNQKSREQIYKSRLAALDEAKKDFQDAEQGRRRAKEELESSSDGADKAKLEQSLSLAQLKSRFAEMRLALRELEVEISKSYREWFERQQSLTTLQIAFLEKRVKFSDDDLKRELNLIDGESEKIQQGLDKAAKELPLLQKDYERARKRLTESSAPSPALIEEVESRRLAQSSLEQQIELLSERLKHQKELQDYWKSRYRLLNDQIDKPEIAVWQQQTRQYLEQIKRDEDLSNLRLTSLRNSSAEIEEKIHAKQDADPETRRWLQGQKDAIQASIGLMQDNLASLLLTRKLYEKFLAEQESRYAHVTFGERLSRFWDRCVRVWNYEITSVDDSPITVSKVFFALVLMFFGLMLARRLSNALASRLLPRFGVAPGVAAALRTLVYYALVLFFVLTALHLVRVPLTMFAVLGGAVAIGIGFGSQNMMNNFISGIILLIERPIKMGDIIEMEGNAGIVEQIGGRSTIIRTFSNIHMIIPNSAFLEKTVVNWTLSDNMIRSNIKVGVDYDASTRQVVDLLKKAAESHGKILKTPEPIVLFTDFSSDSLVFDLYFWLKIQTALERRIVESDLRFMIEGSFKDAGINMAYPQRDVHLDTRSPLQVKVVQDDSPPKPSSAAS